MLKPLVYVILIILILLPVIYKKLYENKQKHIKVYDYKTIEYNTGDVIFFKWRDVNFFNNSQYTLQNYGEDIIRVLYDGNTFSHVGVIIVINDIPYIYELVENFIYKKELRCYYSKKKLKNKFNVTPHAVLHPLKDIETYNGDVFIMKCNQEINSKQIFNMLKKFTKAKRFVPMILICRIKNIRPYSKYTCSGFVVDILNFFNILKIKNPNSLSPVDMYSLCLKNKCYSNNVIKIKKFYSDNSNSSIFNFHIM